VMPPASAASFSAVGASERSQSRTIYCRPTV
jgi:hypothetical protein